MQLAKVGTFNRAPLLKIRFAKASKVENQECGKESSTGAYNLVDNGIRSLQLDNVASKNILRNNSTNELDHSLADTDDRIDEEEDNRVSRTATRFAIDRNLAYGGDVNDDDGL
ncbi:hypothetical protein BGZ80_001241 [Entomortierella chlamydospora]|uniref:Uncharacterized protein n=1 Tax=Entomortierella chlamydospora TaxID=101097 RepID=A0A9P6T3J5_9FUNG|nr:hypothetical protein BGZ79_010883 [Entomortierella chlamydospora]KAG0022012.1 hypothetical protein BGZ80_001241 [Entomortierella chlamydospora]